MTYKVAAYIRLSKEEYSNEKESNSITNQKLIIDNYLKEISEFNILELSRTGITAMERGDKIPTIDLTDNY